MAEMKSSRPEFPPSQLIDGDFSSIAHSHEETNGMWIRVTLNRLSLIFQVIVINRQYTLLTEERIIGASVFIKKEDQVVRGCGSFDHAKLVYAFSCVAFGDVIEISQEGQVGVWNLAEILAYGNGEFLNLGYIIQFLASKLDPA